MSYVAGFATCIYAWIEYLAYSFCIAGLVLLGLDALAIYGCCCVADVSAIYVGCVCDGQDSALILITLCCEV